MSISKLKSHSLFLKNFLHFVLNNLAFLRLSVAPLSAFTGFFLDLLTGFTSSGLKAQ